MDGLAAFVACAQSGSMRQAAVDLGVSHVAVQKAVERLERHVGESLVERSQRGVKLTACGRAAFVTAQRITWLAGEAFGRR